MAVTVEKLELLYETVVFGQELKTAILNEMGFNSNHLAELIENNVLKREKKGIYIFIDFGNLYFYGKKLLSLKRYDDANKCFEKCYELDSNHKGASFQLFLRAIDQKDYIKAFEYFDVFFETDNPHYNADANLYLYLLNLITDIPEKHKAYVKCLHFKNIKVEYGDKRFNDICLQNRIRTAILNGKFAYALNQMGSSFNDHDSKKVQTIIIRKLVHQAIAVENMDKAKLFELVISQNYNEVVDFLKSKQSRQNLSQSDTCSLKLALAIIDIKRTNKIPKINFAETTDWCVAIDNRNYGLAKRLNDDFCQKYNLSPDQNIISLLLSQINDLIFALKENNEVKKTQTIANKENQSEIENLNALPGNELRFYDVIKHLMENNLDRALKTLKEYLNSIKNQDYEFLILDLIRLSLLEHDIVFIKPTTVLAHISKGDFIFNLDDYIQAFYTMFFQNKFAEARIYLNIITNAKTIGYNCSQIETFSQALDLAEKTSIVNAENKPSINLEFTKSVPPVAAETKEIIKSPKPEKKISPAVSSRPVTLSSKNTCKTEENSDELDVKNAQKVILDSIDKLLKGQGIVLLKPMNKDQVKRFYEVLEEYPDLRSFSINSDGKDQIVLRYNEHKKINPSKLIALGNNAFQTKKYSECIEYYLQLLQIKEPKAFVYGTLGASYLKMGNIAAAIDYMTVATRLNSDEENICDYSEMLLFLKGEIKEKKPRFKMRLAEFDYGLEDIDFDINDLDQITKDILSSGLDIDTICEKLGMSSEDIDAIKLIYAKEYYSQGDLDNGDLLLKSVERNKNKTKRTAKMFEQVRNNRNFYANRKDSDAPRLERGLKPRKNN